MLEIKGYVLHWNVNYDDDNTQIRKGAFDKSIQQRSPLPIMYNHDDCQPIGTAVEFTATDKGLWLRGNIYVESVFEHIEMGSLRGLSVHYIEQEQIYHPVNQTKILTRGVLMEVSLVSCPAAPYFIETFKHLSSREDD